MNDPDDRNATRAGELYFDQIQSLLEGEPYDVRIGTCAMMVADFILKEPPDEQDDAFADWFGLLLKLLRTHRP